MGMTVEEIIARGRRKGEKAKEKVPERAPEEIFTAAMNGIDGERGDDRIDPAMEERIADAARTVPRREIDTGIDVRKALLDKRALNEEILARASLLDPYVYAIAGTKTKDEQADDGVDPYRPFPQKLYIEVLLAYMSFPVARGLPKFIWKSRTMMATWGCCLHTTHYAATHQATSVVYQSQDEDRATHMVDCDKILLQNSLERLKKRWVIDDHKIDQMAYNWLELPNTSTFVGLVGTKTKVKSRHPTIWCADEAAFMLELAACIGEAKGAKTRHIYCISSSELGFMNDQFEDSAQISAADLIAWVNGLRERRARLLKSLTETGNSSSYSVRGKDDVDGGEKRKADDGKKLVVGWNGVEEVPVGVGEVEVKSAEGMDVGVDGTGMYAIPCKGVSMHVSKQKGYQILRVHYTADPAMRPENFDPKLMEALRKSYPTEAIWQKEMEINPRAAQGARIYPEFSRSVHTIRPDEIPRELCVYMATDPHPRTPHAHLWIGVDRYNDLYAFRELWPSITYGVLRRLDDTEEENKITIKDYIDMIAEREGNSMSWKYKPRSYDPEYGKYTPSATGEEVMRRYMDQAGKAFGANGENEDAESYFKRYKRYGLYYKDPKKSHKTGEDAIREALVARPHDLLGKKPRLMVSTDCIELILEMENIRYAKSSKNEEKEDQNQNQIKFRTHLVDLVRYILVMNPYFNANHASIVKGLGAKYSERVERERRKKMREVAA